MIKYVRLFVQSKSLRPVIIEILFTCAKNKIVSDETINWRNMDKGLDVYLNWLPKTCRQKAHDETK